MSDAKKIATAFREIYLAAMEINAVLAANDHLNTTMPANWPLQLSADEFAAECQSMAEHYDALNLEAFRATRSTTRVLPDDYLPSDAPATETYSYDWDGQIWWVRREGGEYVFSWTHPCNEARPTLAEAEAALFDTIPGDHGAIMTNSGWAIVLFEPDAQFSGEVAYVKGPFETFEEATDWAGTAEGCQDGNWQVTFLDPKDA